MKKLSIYIPTYNRKGFLKRQLDFIFTDAKEHMSEIEVIISDNASNDGTKEMVEELSVDYDLTYCRNESNLGIVANAYLCEKYSNGEFLWTIGDDDILSPGIVNKVFHIIEMYPNINFIFLNHAIMHSRSIEYGYSFPVVAEELCQGYMEDASDLVLKNFAEIALSMVSMTSKIVRKELRTRLQKIIPVDSIEAYGHDLIISLAAIREGKSYFDSDISFCLNYANSDWLKEILLVARYGTQRSIRKLSYFGYTENEIKYIYQSMLEQSLVNLDFVRRQKNVDSDIFREFQKYICDNTGYSPQQLENIERILDLPFVNQMRGKRIVIYGAGRIGKALYKECLEKSIEVVAWCDSNYERLKGIEIESPEIIQDKQYDYVIIAVAGHDAFIQIYNLLTRLGVEKDKIKQIFPTYKGRIID